MCIEVTDSYMIYGLATVFLFLFGCVWSQRDEWASNRRLWKERKERDDPNWMPPGGGWQ